MAGEESKISTYETYVSTPNERTVLLVRPRNESWTDRIGLGEVSHLNFWRSILAEFIISLLFIMFSCGNTFNDANALHQGISVGFLVAVLICVMPENGGFFNPAISFGLLVSRRMKYTRFFFNLAAQIIGSIAGAGLLYLYSPKSMRGNLGVMSLHADISDGIGFIMEMTLTFVLMWTVLTGTDPQKKFSGFQTPLAIGFASTVGILTGFPFTGAALNPIRAFGPAVIMNSFSDHWVYWVGPLIGALLSALAYDYIFKPSDQPEPRKDLPTVQLHINANSQNSEF